MGRKTVVEKKEDTERNLKPVGKVAAAGGPKRRKRI